jgi:hypothetical protein
MKLTKILMCALAVGAATVVTSNVYAVPGPVTVSGTALSQDTKGGYDVAKKNKFTQKILLQVLAQATGDSSITNKKTTVYYDPGAFNTNAYDSNQGYYFYGVFYYSNSVAGLTKLDGIDGSGDYYSYIELDYYNWLLGESEGFWDGDSVEYNTIIGESKNKATVNGNALLYIHSNPYDYDLPDGEYYYANDWDGDYQPYAFVMHGPLKYGASISGSTMTTTGKLSGSGDGLYDYNDLVVSGNASFKAKGPAPE